MSGDTSSRHDLPSQIRSHPDTETSLAQWMMSLNSQAGVDHAIAARDREIARIVEEKRLLRNRRNALAPINRLLPPEILSEIFLALFRAHRESWAVAVRFPIFPHSWIVVTFVCQYWRKIALRSPRLWQHIICTRSDNRPVGISRMSVWIKRSGRLPLTFEQFELILDVHQISYTVGSPVMSLIMQEASRVQRLSITVGGLIMHESIGQPRILNFPALQCVTIVQTFEMAPASLKIIRESRWPNLKTLRCIESSPVLIQAFLRSALTKLYVRQCSPSLPVSEWARILVALPALANLTLIHSVVSDEPPEKGPVVSMPNLQYLWVQDRKNGLSSAQLLSCLAVPSSIRAHIAGDEPVKEPEAQAIIAQLAAKAAGRDIIGEPWVARVCVAEYQHEPRKVTLILYAMDSPLHLEAGRDIRDHKSGFSVTLALGDDSSIREPIIRTFYSLISLTDVEGIIFAGPVKRPETFEMLLRPQKVYQLEAYTHYTTGMRLLRLLRTGVPVDGGMLAFPFPRLGRLTLHIVTWFKRRSPYDRHRRAQAFVRLLADTLEERARHGLRLAHLKFTCCAYTSMTACENDFARVLRAVDAFEISPSIQDSVEECESCVDTDEGD